MRVSVVATGIDAEAQGEVGAERGAERDTAFAKAVAPVTGPEAGKESVPKLANAAFLNPAVPAKSPGKLPGKSAGKPAAKPVGSDSGKVKLRFDPDARPSAGPLFPSRATRRPEPAPVSVKPVSEKAVSVTAENGDVPPGQRPSLAAPDPAERILPNGADRKPPPVFRLPRH